MIEVELIFKSVQDLSRKDKSGYMNSEEFTRDLNRAQELLLSYYSEDYGRVGMLRDSLIPFLKEVLLPIDNGFADFPSDYRHRIEVGNVHVENVFTNCSPAGDPISKEYPCRYLHPNEERLTISSPIRKPAISKNRYYHTFVNEKIKILPKEAKGSVAFKYIMNAPIAKYATVVNTSSMKEDFDPVNSINLVWQQQDINNIVDIMLLFKGIQVREGALISWLGQKKQLWN